MLNVNRKPGYLSSQTVKRLRALLFVHRILGITAAVPPCENGSFPRYPQFSENNFSSYPHTLVHLQLFIIKPNFAGFLRIHNVLI